ncbi:CapA family protein [Halorientalis halophila]|uniref:CapA family protein n=1 Tax=Halorientalis halophila TaxID=3108499 RepID=UPI00300B46E1
MEFGVSRRQLLRATGASALVGLAGCGVPNSGSGGAPISGAVTDLQGSPVPDATVEVIGPSGGVDTEARTDEAGRFEVTVEQSVWVRASHPEYLSRVRAVTAGDEPVVRLTPDTGTTVSLGFGGDVMFGRRFYDTGGDGLSERARIDPGSRQKTHRDVLRPIRPLLEHTDIMSINLETPLTTTDWTFPGKTFQFTSHPVAAGVLADSGVDYAALGNNHVFDALTPGLEETRAELDRAGIARSGAGMSSDEAWQPAVFETRGPSVAYVSCTTVVGDQYDRDWSADRSQADSYTLTQNGRSLTVPGDAGVAEATAEKLRAEVTRAASRADVVVVQIHGGQEYQREPTDSVRQLTGVAVGAGADLVVNHHPHVTGGLEIRDGSLIAWSLGNLVFDQVLWETLRSYVLVAHVDSDGLQRVLAEPVLLDGYVPKGTAGAVRNKIARDAAALSTGQLRFGTAGRAGVVTSTPGTTTTERRLGGPETVYERDAGGTIEIADASGTVAVGRDRLYTGSFEEILVDGAQYTAPLWRFRRGPTATGPTVGRETGGLRLTSYRENSRQSILSPVSRIPIEGQSYTLTGWYRSETGSSVELLVPWYSSAGGSSFDGVTVELETTDGDWQQFRYRLVPPDGSSFLNLFALLSPPEDRDSNTITVDDVRLIEWEEPSTDAGRHHEYLYVEDEATVRVDALAGADEIEWTEL